MAVCVFFISLSLPAQEMTIRGLVADAQSGEPLIGVNIVISNSNRGAVTDDSGRFVIPMAGGADRLHFSHVGYADREMAVPGCVDPWMVVRMYAVAIPLADEVVIYGERQNACRCEKRSDLNGLMKEVTGVDQIERAHFASEPVIRGMSTVSTTIDGMKVFGACVDHMDPINAYVETENLKSLEISKGGFDLSHSGVFGGSVNLVTNKPEFGQPIAGEAEIGYESVSRLRRGRAMVNFSHDNWAWRGTMSTKRSGDMTAGNGQRVGSSGFSKDNFKIDVARQAGDHEFCASLIGDHAWDIGYPAMLMDARKTISYIMSVDDDWKRPVRAVDRATIRVYFSTIRHWMDDYDRDVSARNVMTGMFMPMYGSTRTFGALTRWYVSSGNHATVYAVDYHHLEAFADMDMISQQPGVSPMYVVNVGDAHVDNLSVVADHTRLWPGRWSLRWGGRVEFSARGLSNRDGRRVLEGAIGRHIHNRVLAGVNTSATVRKGVTDESSITLKLARNQRMPSHLENFGFYVYNLADGFFYTGNPRLKPETSYQAEIGGELERTTWRSAVALHYTHIENMILGVFQSETFKQYGNVSRARMAGVEWENQWKATSALSIEGGLSLVSGHNVSLDEPLPFVPPLKGRITASYGKDAWSAQAEWVWASSQNRTAHRTTLEDRTPGYHVVHVRASKDIGRHVTCKFGIENVLDRLYHDHMSVNNFPAPGRNAYVAVLVKY